MSSSDRVQEAGAPAVATGRLHRMRRLAVIGVLATVVAMVAVVIGAALARVAGADFELPGGQEAIPLPGFAVVTGVFSIMGVLLAAGILRWSDRPADRFLWTAVTLTAASLVPPFLAGGSSETTVALVALHLVAAGVMVPALTRTLRSLAAGAEAR